MAEDFDIISDLVDGTADSVVSANNGSVGPGGIDAVGLNESAKPPVREPTLQAKPVGDKEPASKPLSLRDQISSAFKSEVDTPPTASQDGKVRDPATGQFVTKPVEIVLDPASAPKAAAPAGIDPQVFSSLPAETQATLARTMEDISTRQQRFAKLEPIEQLIAPRVEAWAMNGREPAQALHQLLALSDFAGRDPTGFVKYFAQNNGIDLEEMVLGMDPPEPVDPKMAALEQQIAELKGFATQTTQEQKQAAHTRTVDSVVAFASEKGEGGHLLRPHFEELGNAVLPYISMVKAQNPSWSHDQVLQQAYDSACWGTKSVRDKMQVAANAAAEAERLRAQTERVTSARTASASVRSGAPTGVSTAPNDASRSLRDTIRASIAATN